MLAVTYPMKRKRIKVAKCGTPKKYLKKRNCDCDLSPFKQVVRKILLHSFLFEGEVAWQETFIVPFSVPPVSQNEKKNLQVIS